MQEQQDSFEHVFLNTDRLWVEDGLWHVSTCSCVVFVCTEKVGKLIKIYRTHKLTAEDDLNVMEQIGNCDEEDE